MMTLPEHLSDTDTVVAVKPHYQVWWHMLIAWVMRGILALAGRNFNRFWTTLGRYIYAPAGEPANPESLWGYTILCHELAHRYDDRDHGWSYRLSYVFSGKRRAEWEVRGYGMQMVAMYRQTGTVPATWPRRFAEHITGAAYLWAGEYDQVLDSLETIRKDLIAGKIDDTRFHPDAL